MNRFVTYAGWRLFDATDALELNGTSTVAIRCDEASFAYGTTDDWQTETLLGYGVGEYHVTVKDGADRLRVSCSGRVWIRPNSVNQTTERIDADIFTTLDRPAPLSPEMRAIQEMVKRNELNRERDRADMLEMMRNVDRDNRTKPEKPPSGDKPKSDDDGGSSPDVEEPQDDEKSGVRAPKPGRKPAGAGAKDGKKAGNPASRGDDS